MDIEQARYIIRYYSHFFNKNEQIAHRHINSLFKLNGEDENSSRGKMYKRKGWITTEKEALKLIKNGETEFYINTAHRILIEHPDDVFLNKCPNCQKLARTPNARQCRQCGNKWFKILT